MNIPRGMLPLAVLLGLFGAAACTPAPPVQGTVVDKYIEDFEEFTLVVQEADGDKYHFTVEAEQWRRVQLNQPFNSADIEAPSED